MNTKEEAGAPEIDSAADIALGPGTVTIAASAFFFRTALTNLTPGSEIVGVPASETRAISFPARRAFIARVIFPKPLNE